MPKRGRHRRGSNPAPHRQRPAPATRPRDHDEASRIEPELLRNLRRSLDASHPLDLLELVSMMLEVLDSPKIPPADDDGVELASRDSLIESLFEVGRRETSAALVVIGEFLDDEVLRARIQREVRSRAHQLPRWLTRLSEVEVYQCTEMVHVLGDGDDLLLGVRLGDGGEFSCVVYVDHNVGTIVKDAFFADRSIDELIVLGRETAEPDTEWHALDPADARARIVECIARAALVVPPFESQTWPANRPLVEWVARQLPEGGTPYVMHEWSDDERDGAAARFLASPYGRDFDRDEHHDLLDQIVWFGAGYGVCDPMRWSAARVEILLLDWIPRRIVAPVPQLALVPDLLRAFIRFAGAELGLRARWIDETVAAVDDFEPEYLDLLSELVPFDDSEIAREWLGDQVGGEEALVTLDTEPLPDEPFSWDGIPDDVHERVLEVLDECDRCADALFDGEFRTACRRLLAAVVVAEPTIFRRRARSVTAASAICWMVGKANHVLSWYGGVMVKDMAEHFGIDAQAVNARADTFFRALGLNWRDHLGGEVRLHSTAYLTGARRRGIIEARDRRTDFE